MKKLVLIVLFGIFAASAAQAGARVNALGGITMANPSESGVTPVSTYKAKSAMTYGATVDFDVNPMIAIETGILSVGGKIEITTSGVVDTAVTRAIEVPFLVRFTALPILDFGVGGYYQKFNSTFELTDSAGTKTTYNWNTDFFNKTTDYGAKLSARLMLPLAPMIKFVVDANYKMGMANLNDSSLAGSTAGRTFKNREMAALAGISIGF
jgi:hypothetical protein